MKLSDAANYFDRTEATDPVTGRCLFLCQIDVYDDSKRDASAAYRRILSVRPGTAMPPAGVIRALGEVWLLGGMEPDGLAELHRQKYVLQKARGQMKVSRLSGFLTGEVASTVWAFTSWVKDTKQVEVSSRPAQLYDITLPQASDVRERDVVWAGGEAYLVLSPRRQASQYLIAECLQLDQVEPAHASIATRVYNPVTGTYAVSLPAPVQALAVRWQSLFEYESQASERYQEGDVAIVLPAGTEASTGTLVTLDTVTYQTISSLALSGAVVLHSRVL